MDVSELTLEVCQVLPMQHTTMTDVKNSGMYNSKKKATHTHTGGLNKMRVLERVRR